MVYVLLGTGFEEMEALAPIDLLRRANIPVMTVGISGKTVYGGHNIGFEADISLDQMDLSSMEMLVLPGGLGGVASVKGCRQAMNAVEFAAEHGKLLAAICAAPTILGGLGLLDGKKAVCYPGCEEDMGQAIIVTDKPCIRDGQFITGTSAGCAIPFALLLIEALRGKEDADRIAKQIVIR